MKYIIEVQRTYTTSVEVEADTLNEAFTAIKEGHTNLDEKELEVCDCEIEFTHASIIPTELPTRYITLTYNDGMDIVVEDGSVASIHHNGDNYITTYYQDRISLLADEPDWENVGEGKQYMKDWDASIGAIDQAMITDALEWLVVSQDKFIHVGNSLEELRNGKAKD